ncbi:helix-turn-helix domain-containing protein [Leifsonia shinshuensis]|uniref:helix-turn-helix domain-containing protein n=1 Tax=Leifsonia shinshuensis TaxID=150026 RepID=UPI002862156E|nr:helix-turn-helix domain-containing protein [Leifsonia shinshuensis]MDR6970844.1 excisionase family DNA binding protein [Leifsonia shinshuensis]
MQITEERLRQIIREELRAVLKPADEEPVAIEELAAYLKLSTYTVAQKAHWGYIPGFKVGREWRFYISEVLAALTPPSVVDPWQQSPRSEAGRRAAITRRRNAAAANSNGRD